jgi:NAD(P)H-dependent FMN reductase
MLQIISATNRPDSFTYLVSKQIQNLLSKNTPSNILSLESLNNANLISENVFSKNKPADIITTWQKDHLIPSDRWIIVAPEYNGSYPGILKFMLDALSVQQAKDTFYGKKVGLIGVSTGRAGNLRGMDHLTGVLHYLNMDVMPFKLPISTIDKFMLSDHSFSDTVKLPLEDFITRFLAYSEK